MLKKLFDNNCYMLDVETDGLDTVINGVTSFCLVKFDLLTENPKDVIEDYIHHSLNGCINIDLGKKLCADTTQFRIANNISYYEQKLERIDRLDDIAGHITSFVEANCERDAHIFALHTEFDIAFLLQYFNAANEKFPFEHRNVWEIASLIKGMGGHFQDERKVVKRIGILKDMNKHFRINNFEPHNALYDCIEQIYTLRHAIRLTKGTYNAI